ncbi:MAG: ABC transporter permease [Candidatus Heimdallarchaeota archaeon]
MEDMIQQKPGRGGLQRFLNMPKIRLEDPGTLGLFALAVLLLTLFILAPVGATIWRAFLYEDKPSLFWFKFVLGIGKNVSLQWRKGIINALFAGAMTVVGSSIIGIPTAWMLTRFRFYGKSVFRVSALIPLIIPPFVGAFAMNRLLARNGMVSNFISREFLPILGIEVENPATFALISDSVWGIIYVQTVHLWPLIYLNVASSLSKIDPTLEQSARNLGASGVQHFFKITFPLALPGYAAGVLLVFIWSIADLGTPLMLHFHQYAPVMAFSEIVAEEKPLEGAAYATIVIITIISILTLLAVSRIVGTKEYATVRVGAAAESVLKPAGLRLTIFFWLIFGFLTLMSSIPHIGLIFVTFGKRIPYGEWFPPGFSANSLQEVLTNTNTRLFILNSLVYSFLAMLLSVFLGAIIGYILVRKQIIGKKFLDISSMAPFAIPGIVIASGYIYFFKTPIHFLGDNRLTNFWFILVLAYGMRRLPYAVRSTHAVLQQIHPALEEAASNLGASGTTKFSRITLPLMAPGILAGGTLAFISSFTEVSTSIVIQPQHAIIPGQHARPITLGIYNLALRGGDVSIPGALGCVQLIVATIGFIVTNKILGARTGVAFGA